MGHSVTQALHDWQRGDQRGSYELDRRLRADLLALVRSRRSQRYQGRIDSEAVVNAALKSFLSGAAKGEFLELNDRVDVKRLLAHFALCVLRDQVRGLQAAKRDARRDVCEPELVSQHAADLKQPTPEECAMAVEYWEKFPEVVRGVHEKSIEILELSLEGLSAAEIAQELGLGVRTVQLIIQRMIEAWQRWLLKGP
jgi:DNA-directed RNA polymerase specialized sigma24 family protein